MFVYELICGLHLEFQNKCRYLYFMKNTAFTICLLLLGFLGAPARADLSNTNLFTLNTIYLDRDYTDNGVKYKYKTTDTDIRLGHVFRQAYAGIIYSQSANDSTDSNRTSYGLSGGYFSDRDLYIQVHYFLTSKYDHGGGIVDDKGTGYEIDLGGLFRFTSSFYLGLLMAYKSFSYTQRTINGVSAGTSVAHRELMPLFTVGFALQ